VQKYSGGWGQLPTFVRQESQKHIVFGNPELSYLRAFSISSAVRQHKCNKAAETLELVSGVHPNRVWPLRARWGFTGPPRIMQNSICLCFCSNPCPHGQHPKHWQENKMK